MVGLHQIVAGNVITCLEQLLNRAVVAGPAGPAAAGPIFGQLTRAKMPYEL